jgi:hypothetical protein
MPSPDHPLGVRRSPEGEMHERGIQVQRGKSAKVKWRARARARAGARKQTRGTEARLIREHIFGSQVSADRDPGTGLQVRVRVRVRVLNLQLLPNT